MDEVDELIYENETLNATYYTYELQETLTIRQILDIFWSIISLIPNVILLYILLKHALNLRSNFYFVILNWTAANTILITSLLLAAVVPEVYSFPSTMIEILEIISLNISFVPVAFGTLFVFDKFINSKNFCRYSIYIIWVIIGLSMLICTIALEIEHVYALRNMLSIVVLPVPLFLLIVIIKSIVYCIQKSEEETSKVRLIMAYIYILINCFHFFLTHSSIPSVPRTVIRHLVTILFYGDTFYNLVLLIIYDPVIKIHFYQLFHGTSRYINVHFSRKDSGLISPEEEKDTVLIP